MSREPESADAESSVDSLFDVEALSAAGVLPRLRVLRLHGRRELSAEGLYRFLRLCPALEELHGAGVSFRPQDGHPGIRGDLIQLASELPHPVLRVQAHQRAPLPRVMDVACAMCDALLWRRLTRFVLAPRFQAQQECVVYTNEQPAPEDISCEIGAFAAHLGWPATQILCRNRCHAPLSYYLADSGSFTINLRGWRYVIAVGPASIDRMGKPSPPLTKLVPLD